MWYEVYSMFLFSQCSSLTNVLWLMLLFCSQLSLWSISAEVELHHLLKDSTTWASHDWIHTQYNTATNTHGRTWVQSDLRKLFQHTLLNQGAGASIEPKTGTSDGPKNWCFHRTGKLVLLMNRRTDVLLESLLLLDRKFVFRIIFIAL